MGCHHSNKSVRQISALQELPRSTVSAVIVMWKCLGATTAQPRNAPPHKLTERDRQVLKRIAGKNRLLSVVTLYQTDSGSNVSTNTVHRELHEMSFHGGAAAHKPKITMHNAQRRWSGGELTAIGLWSSGNTFSGVMNHASPSCSRMDESGFGECQENATYPYA